MILPTKNAKYDTVKGNTFAVQMYYIIAFSATTMILAEIIWELKEVFNNSISFDVYVSLYLDTVKVGGFKNIDWNPSSNK